MFEDKLKAVVSLEAKAREARVELERTRVAELKAMPARFGYADLESFIKALREAAGKRGPRTGAKRGPKAAPKAPKAGKRKRAKITPEIRANIVASLKDGSKTAMSVAKEFGVSYPTIMNIKKAAGLMGVSSEVPPPPPAAPVNFSSF